MEYDAEAESFFVVHDALIDVLLRYGLDDKKKVAAALDLTQKQAAQLMHPSSINDFTKEDMISLIAKLIYKKILEKSNGKEEEN